jgi:hypothetical protein
MSIVSTAIVSDGGNPRRVLYRCTDHLGATHDYGPVTTTDAAFNAEAHKVYVALVVAESVAEREAEQLFGDN